MAATPSNVGRDNVCGVLLVTIVTAVVLALFVLQILPIFIAALARCKNVCGIVTISTIGLIIQSILAFALYKGITGCHCHLDFRFFNNSFLINDLHELDTDSNSNSMNCCGNFRFTSILLSVINFIVLIHQKLVNNVINYGQRVVLYCAMVYLSVMVCVMGWVYWTPGRSGTTVSIIRSFSDIVLPICPQQARGHILAVVVEAVCIYAPALYILLAPRNQENGQPFLYWECTIFKNCLAADGSHCNVCCGANELMRDSLFFYALIILFIRPIVYIYYFFNDEHLAEIFAFGCNMLISIVISINATPYLNRIFKKNHNDIYNDVITATSKI